MTNKFISGKYQVTREIGRGGMGIVYEALDTVLNRTVAIKALHAHFTGDSAFLTRFQREARAMARLDHSNIIRIFDIVEDSGSYYIVMEYFQGKNLKQVLSESKSLSKKESVSIMLQVAKALSYAHEQGIIHRDIKPENIMVNDAGTAKIADFGIAAATDEVSVTMTGQVIGTPKYMSPEQAQGEDLDSRSDLYSLGMVLYEMLTGQSFYRGIPSGAVYEKLLSDLKEFKLSFPPDILSPLQNLVRSLLKKERQKRLPDAATLATRLSDILSQYESGSPGTSITIPPSSTTKQKASFLLAEIIRTALSGFLEKLKMRPNIKANDQQREDKDRNSNGENKEAKQKIDLTQIEQASMPSAFFRAEEFQGTLFFKNKSARYSEVEKRITSNRDKLDVRHTTLLNQAKTTYRLWVISVSLGFSTFLFGIISMLLGNVPEGVATASATGIVYFIQKIFQQREDHYTTLAREENRLLEYGEKWLLAIQTIDAMEDSEEKSKRQARLAEVITARMS